MLTDTQREQLATLAPGETTVLVDVVKCPHPEILDGQPVKDGFGFWWWRNETKAWPIDPPHGKPGDEFTESFPFGGLMRGSRIYNLRIKSVGIRELGDTPIYILDKAGLRQEGKFLFPYDTDLWLTEVEREVE